MHCAPFTLHWSFAAGRRKPHEWLATSNVACQKRLWRVLQHPEAPLECSFDTRSTPEESLSECGGKEGARTATELHARLRREPAGGSSTLPAGGRPGPAVQNPTRGFPEAVRFRRPFPRQPRRTGVRRSGQLRAEARRRAPPRPGPALPPAGRREHHKPGLVAGREREADGRHDPAAAGPSGGEAVHARPPGFPLPPPRLASPSPRRGRRGAESALAGGSAFPPARAPVRASAPLVPPTPEGGRRPAVAAEARSWPGRAELIGGASGSRTPRPVGERAGREQYLTRPAGARQQRQATNLREGPEDRAAQPLVESRKPSLGAAARAPLGVQSTAAPLAGHPSGAPSRLLAAMKRPPLAEPSCISRRRRRRLLPLLLLLFLHLPGAELWSSFPPAPSGRGARLSSPRKSWAPNQSFTWLPKRLSKKNGVPWLAQKQPGMADNLALREPPRCRLDPLQLGSGRLLQPTLMPVLRRKPRAAQLMRVGCALGTCQVQNLSHRLWQLKGQLGRQDSSPISPNSPHSYG
ncbi:protein ADM2 [Liasis olivaceus]